MAKSLRASSKVKARNARRYTPNTDYAVTQAARLHAISQRLAERTKGPSVSEVQNRQGQDDKNAAGVAEEEMREVEEAVETDGVDAFKGWCLCFSAGEEEMSGTGDGWQRAAIVDLELLGLVDAETIGLSQEKSLSVSVSPVAWMFRAS